MSNKIISNQNVDDNFTCGICHNVYDQPYRPDVCSHVFCKQCLFNSSVNSNNCPTCRRSFDFNRIIFEHQIRNKINSLKYTCDTCSNTVKLNNYNNHSQNCATVTSKYNNIYDGQASGYSSRLSSLSSVSSGRYVNRQTFKCPYCPQANLTCDALRGHCNQLHPNGQKNVICPVCAAMPWGDPNQKSIDFIGHLNLRHKFEYDNFVNYDITEDEMLQQATMQSIGQLYGVRVKAERI